MLLEAFGSQDLDSVSSILFRDCKRMSISSHKAAQYMLQTSHMTHVGYLIFHWTTIVTYVLRFVPSQMWREIGDQLEFTRSIKSRVESKSKPYDCQKLYRNKQGIQRFQYVPMIDCWSGCDKVDHVMHCRPDAAAPTKLELIAFRLCTHPHYSQTITAQHSSSYIRLHTACPYTHSPDKLTTNLPRT